MPVRFHFAKIVLGTVCLSVTVTGCSTTGFKSGMFSRSEPKPQADSEETALADARENLKDPLQTHLAYAKWQEQVGQAAEARTAYVTVLEKNPVAVDAILGIARLDLLAGRFGEAEAGYQRAVSLRPHDGHVLDQAAQFYVSRERYVEAEQLLLSAIAAEPDESLYRYHMGVTQAKMGHVTDAVDHFSRSVGEAEGHYNVAYILRQAGKNEEAERHLRQALAVNPQLTQASTLLAELAVPGNETVVAARSAAKPAKPTFEELPPPDAVGSIVPASADSLEMFKSATGTPTATRTVQQAQAVAPATRNEPAMSLSPGLSAPATGGYSSPQSTMDTMNADKKVVPLEQYLPPLNTSQFQPPSPRPTPASYQTPSAEQFQTPVTRDMTPEQREQWENQMRGGY